MKKLNKQQIVILYRKRVLKMFQSIFDSWEANAIGGLTSGGNTECLTKNIQIIGVRKNLTVSYRSNVTDIIGFCNFILDKREYDENINNILMYIKMNDCIKSQNKLIILPQMNDLLNKIYNETKSIYIYEESITIYTNFCPKISFVFHYLNNPQIIQNLFFDMFTKISNSFVYIDKKVNINLFNNILCTSDSNNYFSLEGEKDYYNFLSNLGPSISNLSFSNKYVSTKTMGSLHLPNLTCLDVKIPDQKFAMDLVHFIEKHTNITSIKITTRNDTIYTDELNNYLITNTHIKELKCMYGINITTISKLLEENTTLVNLSATTDVIRELNVKFIKPNFTKVILNCRIVDFQPIIESNCQFFTIHGCDVLDSVLSKLFEENPHNIPLSTCIRYTQYPIHDTILNLAMQILKKNMTLEMLLMYKKYWIQ